MSWLKSLLGSGKPILARGGHLSDEFLGTPEMQGVIRNALVELGEEATPAVSRLAPLHEQVLGQRAAVPMSVGPREWAYMFQSRVPGFERIGMKDIPEDWFRAARAVSKTGYEPYPYLGKAGGQFESNLGFIAPEFWGRVPFVNVQPGKLAEESGGALSSFLNTGLHESLHAVKQYRPEEAARFLKYLHPEYKSMLASGHTGPSVIRSAYAPLVEAGTHSAEMSRPQMIKRFLFEAPGDIADETGATALTSIFLGRPGTLKAVKDFAEGGVTSPKMERLLRQELRDLPAVIDRRGMANWLRQFMSGKMAPRGAGLPWKRTDIPVVGLEGGYGF
jgi:hypothetical protein